MSSSASRRSNDTLSVNASTRASVGSRKTPPQAFGVGGDGVGWDTDSLLVATDGSSKTTSSWGVRESTPGPPLHSDR